MDKATIGEIVEYFKNALVQHGIEVNSIALFGSGLSGEIRPGSDIDLIIISTDFIDKDLFERCQLTMKAEIDTLKKFKVPMDVLNMSPEEYEETLARKYYPSKIVA